MTENSSSPFGFKDLDPHEKTERVKDVFHSVAENYDLMNDLMSAGVHRLWKDAFVKALSPKDCEKILDMAGGTGDIAFRIHKKLKYPDITICDINNSMLEVGQDRAMDKGILHGLDWICAPAESLPFPDDHFDAYTIAFGLRNVTDRAKALQEAHRVLKPGGKFCCLEFSQVTLPGLDKLYDLYSFNVIPKIGECVTGDRDSYQYLVESIQRFPKQKALLKELQDVGFENVTYRNFTGGVVALHMALKK